MSKLIEILSTDPEIVKLREACYNMTGKWIPFNWDEFSSLEDYKRFLKNIIAEHKS